MKYQIKFYSGDYPVRQRKANADKAICYIEQHFNSVESQKADYCHAKVATNAGLTSKAMASTYAHLIAQKFNVPLGFKPTGVDSGGRGDGNLKYTNMPAILLEPLFISNPVQAQLVKSVEGQQKLAEAIVETVRKHFPNGGLVAFSIGHKGKTGKSANDMGAKVYGGGTEADYAEIVLNKAKAMLEAGS